ncbi:RNA polymerase subunit sigma-70, partial [Bacillus thuringiensis]
YKRKSNKSYQLQEFQQEIYEDRKNVNLTKEERDYNFYVLIKELNEEDKKIFIKRYLDEYSVQEIALEFGMTRDTVYSRLSRGRKKLKKLLGGEKE